MNDLLMEESGYELATEHGSGAAYAGIVIAVFALVMLSFA
jgi:hypothetical protein